MIPHSLGSLQGRTDLGLIVPCRLQSMRLVTLEEVLCHMHLAIKALLVWELFILNFGGASHGEFQGEAFPSSVLPFRFYLCIN